MRLYINLENSDPLLKSICEFACNNTILDICDVANLPGTPVKNASSIFGMNWRFFPTLDPQVSIHGLRKSRLWYKKSHDLTLLLYFYTDKMS
jgi:hypothetical protein